mmetsp:Transcript_35689/g.36166  ORF Transcript_35689/g.36166 Transcript_35689/m.36166 type:complete len:103 (+) Transcript_35689:374-682(+)
MKKRGGKRQKMKYQTITPTIIGRRKQVIYIINNIDHIQEEEPPSKRMLFKKFFYSDTNGSRMDFSDITGRTQEGDIRHINPSNGYRSSNQGFSMNKLFKIDS